MSYNPKFTDLIISTHAPRVMRDYSDPNAYKVETDFYSRASCEARHITTPEGIRHKKFLLTRLV